MILTGISGKRKTGLAFVHVSLNFVNYSEVLKEYFSSFVYCNCGLDFWFMQDIAPKHRSQYMKDLFGRLDISVLPWHVYSSDLNSDENILGNLASDVYGNGQQYDLVATLMQAISSAWTDINIAAFHTYIESTRTRCIRDIQKYGDKIPYHLEQSTGFCEYLACLKR